MAKLDTMNVDDRKLTFKLPRKLRTITHAGYCTLRTTTAFSKLDITGK